MTRGEKLVVALAGLAGVYYLLRQTVSTAPTDFLAAPVSSVRDAIVSTVVGWKDTQQGPVWVPVLNAVELQYGIPTDLLARLAYEESHFRPDIITGVNASSAGALGLMQLEPQYFATARVPTPFTTADTQAQIVDAAKALVSDYETLGDWSLAVAAYNAGLSAVEKAGGIPPFAETQKYVADIMADVPGAANA